MSTRSGQVYNATLHYNAQTTPLPSTAQHIGDKSTTNKYGEANSANSAVVQRIAYKPEGTPPLYERVLVMSSLKFASKVPEYQCENCIFGPIINTTLNGTCTHCPRCQHISDLQPFVGNMESRFLNGKAGRKMEYDVIWKPV